MSVTINNPSYACQIVVGVTAGTVYRPTVAPVNDVSKATLAVGTIAGQVSKEFNVTLTVAGGTPAVIDLSALTDENGASFAITTIEAIKITNKSVTSGEDLIVGGGTNGVISAKEPLVATARGDSIYFTATPIAVDSTHHLLQITTAAGTAVVVVVTVVGR